MKRAVTNYDELGNPIGLADVQDFRNEASYKSYLDLCALNKAKADKRAEEKAKADKRAEDKAQGKALRLHIRRSAWIARLWFEHLLDNGAITLTDEEYQAFLVGFNNGDLNESEMPEAFLEVYGKLKGEDL